MVSYVLYKDKLRDEYLRAFDYVEIYSSAIAVPEQEMEEMLNSLLDTLYEAQENKKPVEMIVGSDLKQFCADYFQGYTHIGNFMKGLVPMFYRFAIVVFLCTLLELGGLEEGTTLFHATTDVGGFLCGAFAGIAAGMIASAVAKTLLFRSKKFTNKRFTVLVVITYIVAIIVSVLLCENVIITVPLFPVLLVSGCYILLYKLVSWMIRYRKYGTIKKSAEERYSLKDTVKEAFNSENVNNQYELLDALAEMYQKKNARLAKRGKAPVTPEEHTENVRKDAKITKYSLLYFIVLFVVCVGGPVLFTEFESAADFVIFLLIMVVVEGAILRFLYKASKAGCEERLALLAQCDAEGITLVELWERRQQERKAEENTAVEEGGLQGKNISMEKADLQE